jgi:hypothetical protein
MLSTKLVKLIESNWEEIATRLTVAVRKHPDMEHLASLPDLDMRIWCQEILENLGYLLSIRREEEVRRRFEILGKMRFEEKIPLHEAVLRVHLLKDKVIGFIHEQGFPMSAAQLYAEEELEHRINIFLDACVYHIVRGYEASVHLERRLRAG